MQCTQFSLPESLDKILRGGRLVHLLAHHLQEIVELDCVVGVILAYLYRYLYTNKLFSFYLICEFVCGFCGQEKTSM